jgi:hypothetical protein
LWLQAVAVAGEQTERAEVAALAVCEQAQLLALLQAL